MWSFIAGCIIGKLSLDACSKQTMIFIPGTEWQQHSNRMFFLLRNGMLTRGWINKSDVLVGFEWMDCHDRMCKYFVIAISESPPNNYLCCFLILATGRLITRHLFVMRRRARWRIYNKSMLKILSNADQIWFLYLIVFVNFALTTCILHEKENQINVSQFLREIKMVSVEERLNSTVT